MTARSPALNFSQDPQGPAGAAVQARLVACHRDLLALVQQRVGSQALARGILQDAFVHGDEERDIWDDDEPAVTWFLRVLRATVEDYQRRHEVTTRALTTFAADLDEKSGALVELRRVVCQAMAGLSENLHPVYARVLQRLEFAGLAAEAPAIEITVKNRNALVVRVFMAREALKKQIILACMTPID